MNQDELRRHRGEWRWRQSVCLRIYSGGRGGGGVGGPRALDLVTASFRGLLGDMQDKLAEMRAKRNKLR